jgi:hypothetical protein
MPTMSALQQTAICGLEKPGFPYPADACRGLERRNASPAGSRRRHAVAMCCKRTFALFIDGEPGDDLSVGFGRWLWASALGSGFGQ